MYKLTPEVIVLPGGTKGIYIVYFTSAVNKGLIEHCENIIMHVNQFMSWKN